MAPLRRAPPFALCSALALSLASCLSGPAKAPLVLPPEGWPQEAAILFLDAKGQPKSGVFDPRSVPSSVLGTRAVLKGVSLSESGEVLAESIELKMKGASASFGPVRLSCQGDGSGWIEYADGTGFTAEIGAIDQTNGLSFSGMARSEAQERIVGKTAYIRFSFDGLRVAKGGRALWTESKAIDIAATLAMGTEGDLLGAAAGAWKEGEEGSPILMADLELSGLPGSGSVVFPGSKIGGFGLIALTEMGEGSTAFNLANGYRLAVKDLSLQGQSWKSAGELSLPERMGEGLSLAIGANGLAIRDFRTLTLEASGMGGPLDLKAGDYLLRGSSFSYAHAARSILSIHDARFLAQADGAVVALLPPLAMKIEAEKLLPASRSFDPPDAAQGYGDRVQISKIAWDGTALAVDGAFRPAGIVDGVVVDFEGLFFGEDGALASRTSDPETKFKALGGDCAFSGLSIAADGASLARAFRGGLAGRDSRDFKLSDFWLAADGATGGTGPGWIGNLAGPKAFTVDSARILPEGIYFSGRAKVYFSSGVHFVDQDVSSSALLLKRDGTFSMPPVLLDKQSFPAFLGLSFSRVSAALIDDELAFVLSGGTFTGSEFWPRGGRVDGLGLNLRTQKYLLKDTVFASPAAFSFRGASLSLEKLDGAMDEAYLFSGRALLPAAPGAPWEAGSELPLKLLRLDEYGNAREIIVTLGDRLVDALPYLLSRR